MSASTTTRTTAPETAQVGRNPVLVIATGFVLVQLMVRGLVLASGNFYWDDLILIGRGSTFPLLSSELLLYDHDGHFMPAAFVVAGIVTTLAPLQWWLPAALTLAMQAAASYAVLRLLRRILGDAPILLLPLTFYLFCPLTIPSFTWWAAALNSLPLQFGLAWVAGDAIESARTGRRRYVVSGAVVTAASLMFFEKSILVPLVAFGTLAALVGVRKAWKDAAPLWLSCAVISTVWGIVYLTVVHTGVAFHGLRTTAELVHHGVTLGLFPTLLGGPWSWERWPPAGPWAAPPMALVVISSVTVFVVLVVSIRRYLGIWAGVAGYVAVSIAAMVLSRSGPDTADELAQTLRYVADSAVVLAVAAALMLRHRPSIGVVWIPVAGAFVVSSLVSTYTYLETWQHDPAPAYLAAATRSLAEAEGTALLDQPISPWVLTPMAYPENSMARIFAGLRDRPAFASSTTDLTYLDETGRLVPAVVAPSRSVVQGPDAGCGYRLDGATRIPLDGPLPGWDWTVQLNYFADRSGTLDVELDTGEPAHVPLKVGLNTVYVRISGSGTALTATASDVCIGSGPVGVVMLENE